MNKNKTQNQMRDAALSSVEETIVVKTPLFDESDRHEPSVSQPKDSENFIPTAIVKPKYQKLSFDERQLPACGSTADNAWQSPAQTTITTTPRKVQKYLPKSSQKSFAKHTRKLVSKAGELCADYDVSDKVVIESLRHRENRGDIDCGVVVQNSVAIVHPLKKVANASAVNMDDGKNQKPIDSSKNSFVMSHKSRNIAKVMSAANEVAPRTSECGNNNLSGASRRVASVARDCEKKVPTTKKKDRKDNSGN